MKLGPLTQFIYFLSWFTVFYNAADLPEILNKFLNVVVLFVF